MGLDLTAEVLGGAMKGITGKRLRSVSELDSGSYWS